MFTVIWCDGYDVFVSSRVSELTEATIMEKEIENLYHPKWTEIAVILTHSGAPDDE